MDNYVPAKNRYQGMKYNRIGNSGLKLPAISAGLWQHFGETDVYANCRDIICRSFDLGITHFDLANNYGNPPGSSEEIFGKILRTQLNGYRDEILIATKAGYHMWEGPYGEWGSKKYLVASIGQSLKRLGLEYVDIFYSHRFDPETPLEETMGTLDLLVRQGKTLYIGISNYDLENTRKAVGILKESGTPCLIHQPAYSMFNRWIEDGLKEFLGEEGIGLIAFQPLQRGLLTNTYLNGIPACRAADLAGIGITEQRVVKARKLNEIAMNRSQSLAQMAIAWVLHDGKVSSVLVGAEKVSHIEENIASLNNLGFTAEELNQIDSILNS